jgi:DNA-binding transcriptional ArsR family regulator
MIGSGPVANSPDVFAALADPTRRWMLQRLARDGSQTPTRLAEDLPISRQAVSRHLSVLEECRLVRAEQVGREQRYHLTPAPLDDARAWMRDLELAWDSRLIALGQLLADQD